MYWDIDLFTSYCKIVSKCYVYMRFISSSLSHRYWENSMSLLKDLCLIFLMHRVSMKERKALSSDIITTWEGLTREITNLYSSLYIYVFSHHEDNARSGWGRLLARENYNDDVYVYNNGRCLRTERSARIVEEDSSAEWSRSQEKGRGDCNV